MGVDGVSRILSGGQLVEVVLGQLESASYAGVNVVTLLKIDVLKKIATDIAGWDGAAEHVDSGETGNRTLNGHEPTAKVLVDAGFNWLCRHKVDGGRVADAKANYTKGGEGGRLKTRLCGCGGSRRVSSTSRWLAIARNL